MTRAAPERPPRGAVLDTGAGPAVLLLHGTAPGTTAEGNFAPLVPALDGCRVLAPDLLGFGDSAKPDDLEYGPQLWARQAWGLLDDRGIDRVAVVGNSMGARIALTMAMAQPARIRGLVLLSTRVTPSTTAAQTLLREYTPSLAGMERLLRECFVTDQNLVTPELVRGPLRSQRRSRGARGDGARLRGSRRRRAGTGRSRAGQHHRPGAPAARPGGPRRPSRQRCSAGRADASCRPASARRDRPLATDRAGSHREPSDP